MKRCKISSSPSPSLPSTLLSFPFSLFLFPLHQQHIKLSQSNYIVCTQVSPFPFLLSFGCSGVLTTSVYCGQTMAYLGIKEMKKPPSEAQATCYILFYQSGLLLLFHVMTRVMLSLYDQTLPQTLNPEPLYSTHTFSSDPGQQIENGSHMWGCFSQQHF